MKDNKNNIIVLNSITHAYKAKDILYRSGYSVYIDRIPSQLRKSGCGYGIKVKVTQIEAILHILAQNNIYVKDVIEIG